MDASAGYALVDVPDKACRQILAAVLVEAVKSAQRGDEDAAGFLDEFGAGLGELIGFELPDWRTARTAREIGASETLEEFRERERERFRKLRERRREDPAWQEKERERNRRRRAAKKAQ